MKRPRRAFTLIEVLVASTIAAMVVTATIGLTFRLDRQQRQLQQRFGYHHQTQLLRESFRRDLRQSTNISVVPGGNGRQLLCSGPISTDAFGEPTLGNADVRYFVADDSLYREELANSGPRRDLLWRGVARMEVLHDIAADGRPNRVRVGLWDNDENPVLNLTCMLRGVVSSGGAR